MFTLFFTVYIDAVAHQWLLGDYATAMECAERMSELIDAYSAMNDGYLSCEYAVGDTPIE